MKSGGKNSLILVLLISLVFAGILAGCAGSDDDDDSDATDDGIDDDDDRADDDDASSDDDDSSQERWPSCDENATSQKITFVPDQVYTLITNKRTAYHPHEYLLQGIDFGEPSFEDEVWRTLGEYARNRDNQCLYLDSDDKLPGC